MLYTEALPSASLEVYSRTTIYMKAAYWGSGPRKKKKIPVFGVTEADKEKEIKQVYDFRQRFMKGNFSLTP